MPSLNNRRWRFHGLKRPKVRQDWNKYNLYNISRLTSPNTVSRTYFQQKWTAKATTRAYHGEVIREKQWERMFSRTSNAVVSMNAKYLAENDGSEFAAGRGSGLDVSPTEREQRRPLPTPYMQMVYHPIERRLDTAVFRALFASSTRQARQFVVHGHVKVNGKKMIYPGYLLNPGDMFQVEPEKVLIGTGAWKGSSMPDETYYESFHPQQRQAIRDAFEGRKPGSKYFLPSRPTGRIDPTPEEEEEEEEIQAADPADNEPLEAIPPEDPQVAIKKQIQSLRARTQTLVTTPPSGVKVSNTRKQELRAFHKTLKSHLSRAASVTPSIIDDLETQLADITSRIMASQPTETKPVPPPPAARAPEPTPTPAVETPATSKAGSSMLSPPPYYNGVDRSKPYATPWRPRDYMPAFAFIPRYLEVNQNICSAVYLRHPVAKPGLGEVPTPFAPETGQLAFNYYLRRR